MIRIALSLALATTLAFAQCDGSAGGGCGEGMADGPSCEKMEAQGCGQGTQVRFPLMRVNNADDRLMVVRQLVRAKIPLCDFDFEEDVLLLTVAPETQVTLADVEAALPGPFVVDHSRFAMPARTTLMFDGMGCMGCAPDVSAMLASIEGVEVLDVQVGMAEIAVAPDARCSQKLRAKFDESRFTLTGMAWGKSADAAPKEGCCPGAADAKDPVVQD